MKQTEVGLIPDDWEVKTLGEIGEPCMCKRILKEQTSSTGDVPFYKIGTFGGIPDAYISRELFEQYKEQYNYPKKGTLLLSAAGTIGRVVVFDGKDSYFQDSNIVWIDNDETKVTNDFLFYCYSRMQWKTEEGGIVSRLYNANLKSTSFIAPKSLAEQQRIAKALSDVDALISTTEKLIQKKKNIKQGAMQNLLTGKKRLSGFGSQTKSPTYKQTELGPIPEDWEVKSLGDIFSIKHGYGFEGQFFSSENNQHIVVTPGNFKLEGGFQKQKQPIYYTGTYPDEFKLKPNDLIIMMTDLSKNSDTLGNPAIVPDDGNDYLHNQRIGLIQIHNDSFVKDYIYLLLCTKEYHEAVVSTAAGSTVKHTSPNRIYSINLVVSTSKEEQTSISNVLSSMDKEIETLNTKLEKYRNLKTAMMQQLLTGKIRLVK
ncbi:restriction endonuclease subunit S [Treponema berlinense]|uniref:restriction endonuclease subunit S n=1 Tax=Treponema berlinense TaxID=225004 RepID=UPI0026EF77D2|nr:restriction endonuclease subunit S [Treponema berlinense]